MSDMQEVKNTPKVECVKTFKLRQQTPLIHFQSGEDGATLRASEVKPKLDRFILSQFGNGDDKEGLKVVQQKNKKWLLGEHQALNYKLRIEADENSKTVAIPYKIVYANMGKGRNNRLNMVVGNCQITIVCFLPQLFKVVLKHIDNFFISHTFGFMQGKGFGGYLLEHCATPNEQKISEAFRKAFHCQKVYCIKSGESEEVLKEQVVNGTERPPKYPFDTIIKPFHSLMKSGINGKDYERSFIFQYFHKELKAPYGNDKAFLKSKGIAPVVYKSTNMLRGEHIERHKDYKYIRGLLGLTEKMEYIHALDKSGKKDQITIKAKEGKIERYASPIRYRIINQTVYIFAVPIGDELYGEQFVFKAKDGQSGTIPIPDKSEFDIEKFLAAFIKHINTNRQARNAAKFFNKEKFEEVQPSA